MSKNKLTKDVLKFLLLIVSSIIITYKAPDFFSIFWYPLLLVLYYQSKNEALWLAFFLVTVDGFIGYFGAYSVTLKILPGLPSIELAQVYILITLIKALKIKNNTYVFYNKYLIVLFIYIIFLIIWGQVMGFSGEEKDYFRIIKMIIPFTLFYSLPKLFITLEQYKRFFTYIFIVLLAAFLTQILILLTGVLPGQITELTAEQISESGMYRGFYNVGITLLGLFGSLFFISQTKNIFFNKYYLYTLVTAAFGMAYLSATRGWIIGFSIIILLFFIFIPGIGTKNIIGFLIVSALIIFLSLSNNILKKQINFASERLETLSSVAEGDLTAEGTLIRLTTRGPRVMKVFRENPVFGWGFSDTARKFSDGHVGNQNILMNSGIIGFLLLIGFMIYFSAKIYLLYKMSGAPVMFKNTLPLFLIFLLGWFIIHSTSGQHFNYMGIPVQIMPQAIFFSFGAFIYNQVKMSVNG